MLRKPGICQKPVITLYETPAYAACGTVVGAEPTGVQPGACTPENGGVADEILFGWQYEVLEENNAFYKIRTHYGYEGWIAAEEYVPMESVGGAGVCYDAQNSGCAMQLFSGLPEYCRRAGSGTGTGKAYHDTVCRESDLGREGFGLRR